MVTHGVKQTNGIVLSGGLALVVGAIGFPVVSKYLAVTFQYPDVLQGGAAGVLPALLATGSSGRAAWAFYALLPMIFVPAGVGAYEALRGRSAGLMRAAMLFALVAAVSMTLGLMRWPSIHWELARAWVRADPNEQLVLTALFDGLNSYLGNYVGEFLGELSYSIFFVLSGVGLLRHERAPVWLGLWGIATGALGLINMWRNVAPAVEQAARLNHYLLPLWMLGFGTWLLLRGRPFVPVLVTRPSS
jgi:hypothetical protein